MKTYTNDFSWSKSRDDQFKACRRMYYFHYYGSWGGWAPDCDTRTRSLYIMKNLASIPMWVGKVVHEEAAQVLRSTGQKSPISQEPARHHLLQKLRSQWEDSKRKKFLYNPKDFPGLQAHYYDEPLDEDAFSQACAHAEACLRGLYLSRPYQRLTGTEPAKLLSIENLDFFLIGNLKVWVQLDLAWLDTHREVEIVDWKTGKERRSDETRIQLGIYALRAQQRWKRPVDEMYFWECNLFTGEEVPHRINVDSLIVTQSYIQESARQMLAMLVDPEKNAAREEDFPRSEEGRTCSGCAFKGACQ
ncbi:MAG: PD-(D/E)XK nuclease family protein [Chloroflexi bacterium]|nr:PD-(D/E)XK nuclease family protein [Chloroflexota bacterium]